mmetsp:Transcript_26655/g.56694  ORF Transcript_26655/g.56694 Transcript_26655/m.56694 type:complete len:90 (-) Transcript_26655:537-806(-)
MPLIVVLVGNVPFSCFLPFFKEATGKNNYNYDDGGIVDKARNDKNAPEREAKASRKDDRQNGCGYGSSSSQHQNFERKHGASNRKQNVM